MKFVKLTNNSDIRKGDPIYINPEHIVCVFEDSTDGGSLSTIVFGGVSPGTRWNIEEGLRETVQKIEEALKC